MVFYTLNTAIWKTTERHILHNAMKYANQIQFASFIRESIDKFSVFKNCAEKIIGYNTILKLNLSILHTTQRLRPKPIVLHLIEKK